MCQIPQRSPHICDVRLFSQKYVHDNRINCLVPTWAETGNLYLMDLAKFDLIEEGKVWDKGLVSLYSCRGRSLQI